MNVGAKKLSPLHVYTELAGGRMPPPHALIVELVLQLPSAESCPEGSEDYARHDIEADFVAQVDVADQLGGVQGFARG